MDRDQARHVVMSALLDVAPDLSEDELDPGSSLRDGAELDSMDFVAFIAALSDAVGSDIPEDDYGQLGSIDQAVEYVQSRG